MSFSVKNHDFYKTYTPFLSPATKSAEKTLPGREYKENDFSKEFSKKFLSTATAFSFLVIPILFLLASRNVIKTQLNKININLFKASNSTSSWQNHLSEKIANGKYQFIKKSWDFSEPVISKFSGYFKNLSAKDNNSFLAKLHKAIIKPFKSINITAANMQKNALIHSFDKLKNCVNKELKIMEASASGSVQIALEKQLLKHGASGLPVSANLSKLADGSNRIEKIRNILSQISDCLKSDKLSFSQMKKKITYSCEDVFSSGEKILATIQSSMKKNKINNPEIDNIIKNIYTDLSKYRFAEIVPRQPALSQTDTRKFYIDAIYKGIEKLKLLTGNNKFLSLKIKNLEKLITENAKPEKMGLLENLRLLLKCNDISLPNAKEGLKPALLKHYRSADYINTKNAISDFAKRLNFAKKVETELLPQALDKIDKGNLYGNLLSVGVPAGILAKQYTTEKNPETKKNKKNILLSFFAGSAAMFGMNYATFKPKMVIALWGLLTTFLTSKIIDKFEEK